MPRKKNYTAGKDRIPSKPANPRRTTRATMLPPVADNAFIEMEILLGENARFASSTRTLELGNWLGRGIDSWVWAAVASLRAILLSGSKQTVTVVTHLYGLRIFFSFLTEARNVPRIAAPSDLSPQHVQEFASWLQKRGQRVGWSAASPRTIYAKWKPVIIEMFAQGFIPGEQSQFFKRGILPWKTVAERKQTSLSDAEQERLARAIKDDLIAIHHGRLTLKPIDIQALRLLLVAHRQGANATPLLEMRRDAIAPGLMPGTVRLRTIKYRSKRMRAGIGRAAPPKESVEQVPGRDLFFPLAEGAILLQAITETESLLEEAPVKYKNRIWLYRSQNWGAKDTVSSLTAGTLPISIDGLIKRHKLVGDDGLPLKVNLTRLRKSFFDRAFRLSDGDLAITANLMGNTPQVAGSNYPTMNESRKAEAASYMNEDFTALMRRGSLAGGSVATSGALRVIAVKPFKAASNGHDSSELTPTAVAGCSDTLHGEHAPHDGHNHCSRYVMCLFCSSFTVVGTVEELWRLFSFQAFAKDELGYLDRTLGLQRTDDERLEDLRDRYRLVIPYIDDFTRRQFPTSRIKQARDRTAADLHPYWVHQTRMSWRARVHRDDGEPASITLHESQTQADLDGK